MPENLIYHYMPLNEYFYQRIINRELYLSNPNEFNDPFDSKYISTMSGTRKEWEKFLKHIFIPPQNILNSSRGNSQRKKRYQEQINIILNLITSIEQTARTDKHKNPYLFNPDENNTYSDNLQEELEYFQRSFKDNIGYHDRLHNAQTNIKYKPLYFNMARHIKAFIENRVGICSFSKEYNETLMWSHYATDHKGVCLAFKCKKKGNNRLYLKLRDKSQWRTYRFQDYELKKVNYLENYETPIINFVQDYKNNRKLDNPFKTKTSSWSYENEYRIIDKIYTDENNEEQKSKFLEFRQTDISQIIFGYRCYEKQKETVKKFINNHPEYRHIKLKQMKQRKKSDMNIKTFKHSTGSTAILTRNITEMNELEIEDYE